MVRGFIKVLVVILIVTVLVNLFVYFVKAETTINRGRNAERQPYVAWVMTDKALCTGVILSNRAVAIARHCRYQGQVIIIFGEYDIEIPDNELTIVATEVITDIPGDIVIVILPYELQFNDKIQSIPIASKIETNTVLSLYGWGLLTDYNYPTILQTTNQMFYNIENSVVCTRDYINESSASSGDSGGPLVQNKQLIGIISYITIINNTKYYTCSVNLVKIAGLVNDKLQTIPALDIHYFPFIGH